MRRRSLLLSALFVAGAARAQSSPLARNTVVCGAVTSPGAGLAGKYLAADGSTLLKRIDGPIDFDAVREIPAGVARVAWSGWVCPPVSGKYDIHVDTPGAVVQVNRAPGDAVQMDVGRFYFITVEVDPRRITDRVRLEWTTPWRGRFLVPQSLLYPPQA